MHLTFARFVEACGGTLVHPGRTDPLAEFVPSTDSRSIEPGETFVCLRGPRFDGHRFAAQAVARGAVAVVADDPSVLPPDLGVAVVAVRDARAAYLAGASVARRLFDGRVIAITGSNGKTTTKEFAAQLAGAFRRVIATPHNENNELGVAKVCYRLAAAAPGDIAVIECGARHPGEIAELAAIARPDIGILTNVGEAHLEFFSGQEDLARTKFGLFSHGAQPVLNAADTWSRMLAAEARREDAALWVHLVGDPVMAGLMLEAGSPAAGRIPLTLGASHAFAEWRLPGEHHLRDALQALAAVTLAGIPFEEAAGVLGSLRLPPGRFETHRTTHGATVVYDAYNASPSSVRCTLQSFAALDGSRKIAVLGSMAELGAAAERYHEAVGEAAARSGIHLLVVGGEHADAIARGARQAGMSDACILRFTDNASLADLLTRTLRPGDCVLLKASRIHRLEEVLPALAGPGALAS